MNRSTPLSADARRLLELGSNVEPPTAEQNERMDRALASLFRAGRPAPTPAASSPLGRAQQRSTSPHGRRGNGSKHAPGNGHLPEHEPSGVRLRIAARTTPRSFDPTLGLRDAKLWLTLGALAATASASFWLGRLSTPGDVAPAVLAPAVLAPGELVSPQLAVPLPVRTAERLVSPSTQPAAQASVWGSFSPASRAASLIEPSDGPVSSAAAPLSDAASEARAPIHASVPEAVVSRRSLPRARAVAERGGAQAYPLLGLAAEIEQLARAEAALRQGRAEHALAVLEQRSVQQLLEQAAALRAIAECELGVPSATDHAREVLARWPASAFQPRISRACQR